MPIRDEACLSGLPARDIERLLRERPNGIGLAVPAMPVGSLGWMGRSTGDEKITTMCRWFDVMARQLSSRLTAN